MGRQIKKKEGKRIITFAIILSLVCSHFAVLQEAVFAASKGQLESENIIGKIIDNKIDIKGGFGKLEKSINDIHDDKAYQRAVDRIGREKIIEKGNEENNTKSLKDGTISSKTLKGLTAGKDEFGEKNDIAALFGNAMNAEMIAWLNNSNNSMSAGVNEYHYNNVGYYNGDKEVIEYNSEVVFHMPDEVIKKANLEALCAAGESGLENYDDILYYIEQSIATYPSLCCLAVTCNVDYGYKGDKFYFDLRVYSPIAKDTLKSVIINYKQFLEKMEKVPRENKNMSDVEKLLYFHDRVALQGIYSSELNPGSYNTKNYIPAGIMVYHDGVCMSYTAIMNQLMKDFGFDCYIIDSDTHTWNAVKLGGKWYYIDITYDDTASSDPDKVDHSFFLRNVGSGSSHKMTSKIYSKLYEGLEKNMGNEYDNYFPAYNSVTYGMYYMNNAWYFVHKSPRTGRFLTSTKMMVKWDGKSDSYVQIESAGEESNLRCAVIDDKLFISGNRGLYDFDVSSMKTTQIDNNSYSGMYSTANELVARKSRTWTSIYEGKLENADWGNDTLESFAPEQGNESIKPSETKNPDTTPNANIQSGDEGNDKTPTPDNPNNGKDIVASTDSGIVNATGKPEGNGVTVATAKPEGSGASDTTSKSDGNGTFVATSGPEGSIVATSTGAPVGSGVAIATSKPETSGTSKNSVKADGTGNSSDKNITGDTGELYPGRVGSLKLKVMGSKILKISFGKTKNTSYYEVWYALKKNFKKGLVIKNTKKTSLKIKGLKQKKKYYVKVRAVRKKGQRAYYGKWSKIKSKKYTY